MNGTVLGGPCYEEEQAKKAVGEREVNGVGRGAYAVWEAAGNQAI